MAVNLSPVGGAAAQFKNTFSLTSATITFSEAPPITSKIEVEY